jgi:predicted RNase H-like nuclease (RuvC/YqgF family)
MQATLHTDLIAQIIDSRVPKTEREHAAAREIELLRDQLQRATSLPTATEAARNVALEKKVDQQQAEIERLRGLVEECAVFLKEDETPAQRIARERADTDAVLKLLLNEKRRTERLRGLLRPFANLPVLDLGQCQRHPEVAVLAINGVAITANDVLAAKEALGDD